MFPTIATTGVICTPSRSQDGQAHYTQHEVHMTHNYIIRAELVGANKEGHRAVGGCIYVGSTSLGAQAAKAVGKRHQNRGNTNIELQFIRREKKWTIHPLKGKAWALMMNLKGTVFLPPDRLARPVADTLVMMSNWTVLM